MYAGHLSKEGMEKRIVYYCGNQPKGEKFNNTKKYFKEPRDFHPTSAEMEIVGFEGKFLITSCGKRREGWEGRGEREEAVIVG